MISTSGVGLVSHDKEIQPIISEHSLVLIAHLFASITRADKKILDIETFTSEVFLNEYPDIDAQKVQDIYRQSLADLSDNERTILTGELVNLLSKNQKISLLRSLSAIAVCDGEVHPEEQKIIKTFMKQMDIDQFIGEQNLS